MKSKKHISLDSIPGLEEIKDSTAESCRGGFFFSRSIAIGQDGQAGQPGTGSAFSSGDGTATGTGGTGTSFTQSSSQVTTIGNATVVTEPTQDPSAFFSVFGGLFSN